MANSMCMELQYAVKAPSRTPWNQDLSEQSVSGNSVSSYATQYAVASNYARTFHRALMPLLTSEGESEQIIYPQNYLFFIA